MKRREFLHHLAVMPMIARTSVMGGSMLASMKNAYAANGKSLVVIFQRGGCDGLNTVVPYGEDEYYNLRPSIGIAPPGTQAGTALDLDGFFGLHPVMTGLHSIFQEGDLAILPTVHYANANRSHFSSQDFIESGVPNQQLADGWLNRYLSNLPTNNTLRAISFSALAHSLKGGNPVVAIKDFATVNAQLSSPQQSTLENIYNQQVNSNDQARFLLHQHGGIALESTASLKALASQSYSVAHGANYPDSDYGQQLKNIAQLIKAGVGLEVATVSSNGWDHHANQGGAQGDQATNLLDFSNGIAALYQDLGSEYMSDVTILTISEFGRTAKQNASLGTDHGNASSWFVIGEQVNGGIYGAWPGLLPSQLYEGRYLDHTINFTDVYAEVLKHLGNLQNDSYILPGSNYQPIGFFS